MPQHEDWLEEFFSGKGYTLHKEHGYLINPHIITGKSVCEHGLDVFTDSGASLTRKIPVMSMAGSKIFFQISAAI